VNVPLLKQRLIYNIEDGVVGYRLLKLYSYL